MTLEAILLLLVLALLLAMLGVLLFRRPSADPALGQALATLQATLAQQASQAAAAQGETRLALAGQSQALAERIAAFTLDQTRALNDGQQALLLALREAAEQAAATALAARERQQADATKAAEQAAALRRELNAALAEGQLKLTTALGEQMAGARNLIDAKAQEARAQLDAKLAEMREANEKKLAEIQKSVNEQLQSAVEKQMNESFTRVIDQFTAIQNMMGNVQAVASQVGDLKRLFGNVKARGGWGEAQVRALLEDILPAGSWDSNVRLREDSQDVVEFTITMPSQGSQKAVMAVDAKFPTEDYDRLLLAIDNADAEAEKAARTALERRIRQEAAKIAGKYIVPPRTVEFAVLYLPNDGLYAEVARIPGLTDEIGRVHRVFVLGPALLPAMLRSIQLGHVTLALSANAEGVRDLLAATRAEMQKMDQVLASLGKQVGTVSNTIGRAQTRTRAINRKLKGVEVMGAPAAEALLELTAEDADEEAVE